MTGRIVRMVTPIALAGVPVIAASGCGGGDALPTAPTIAVTSTAYVTVPARTTTTTVALPPDAESGSGDGADETESSADDASRERIYEIQSGDYLLGIARDYDVPINYLPEYNGWTDGLGHALVPGDEIRIPPADWTPEGEGGDGSSPDSAPASAATECEDGEAPETYTIRSGDTPARVAAAHDVTVDALDAANENTRYYGGFVVGIEINIPC